MQRRKERATGGGDIGNKGRGAVCKSGEVGHKERKVRGDIGELGSREVKLDAKVGKQGKGSGMQVRKLANKGV
jgi:hypothetical protein